MFKINIRCFLISFSVRLSDIDDCAVQPCLNGGNCIDLGNDYTCNCTDGYTGKNCSVGKNSLSFSEVTLTKKFTPASLVSGQVGFSTPRNYFSAVLQRVTDASF